MKGMISETLNFWELIKVKDREHLDPQNSRTKETKKQRESLQESHDVMPFCWPPRDERPFHDQLVAVVECVLEQQKRTENTPKSL